MQLKLGKFEITIQNGNVSITLSKTPAGGISITEELTRIDAIKLRNWLNDYINNN